MECIEIDLSDSSDDETERDVARREQSGVAAKDEFDAGDGIDDGSDSDSDFEAEFRIERPPSRAPNPKTIAPRGRSCKLSNEMEELSDV